MGTDLAIPLPALLNGVGVAGMLALMWWMLATGWLYTRRQHNEIVPKLEERIAYSDKAADRSNDHADKITDQLGATQVQILAKVQQIADAHERGVS